MTGEARERGRILGTLGSAGGVGVVRMEDRFDVGVDEVWLALTDAARLAEWLGDFEGDRNPGGEFSARFSASEWKGTGRIDVCEPPRRLRVTLRDADPQPGQPTEGVTEVTLTPDGDGTIVVWEERGMPVDLLAAYGAGVQIQIEDLGSYLTKSERGDWNSRFPELHDAYRDLAPDAE